ncbi:MAG TPA: MCP four helix bundle domain-containing protein, partial [Burkholderiaceae bacterium]|nr:MCP four helix bundle domain-containing protein [Burkholderiaceae bacterium]
MLAIASTGIWRMTATYNVNHYLQERQDVTNLVNELIGQVELNGNQVQALGRLTYGADLKFFGDQLQQTQARIDDIYTELHEKIALPEARSILESSQEHRKEYLQQREAGMKLVDAGDRTGAARFFRDDMPRLLDAYIAELRRLAQLQETGVASLIDESNAGIQLGQGMIIALGLIAVL